MKDKFKKISFLEFIDMVDELSVGQSFEFASQYDSYDESYSGHWGVKRCREFDADYLLIILCGGCELFAVDISDRRREDVHEEIYRNLKEFMEGADSDSYTGCQGVLYLNLNPS